MKKMMVVFAIMAMVLSLETAFAGDLQAADGSKPYNGVSYFDLVRVSTCNEAPDVTPAKARQEQDPAFSNGISVFEMRKSGAEGSCANRAEKEINSSKPYNGVTVF